ncbi:MAG: hypothetical protein MUC39_04950 [Candidatus Omnitrophica bacterium]|nr:hypothetical protein [Candidatus Omnitrophota bacterium]
MNFKEIWNKWRKDVIIITITFVLGVITAIFFGNISFRSWQKKVAKEALENTKLEQGFCDTAILVLNEKIDKTRANQENINKAVILEYFDNVKNQMVSLKAIINRSKLTWVNIFPKDSEESEKFDKQLLVSIDDVKSLKNDIKNDLRILVEKQKKADTENNKISDQNKKIQSTIEKLESKLESIKNNINTFQNAGSIYPSGLLSPGNNIILPNGNTFSLDNLSTIQPSFSFSEYMSQNNIVLPEIPVFSLNKNTFNTSPNLNLDFLIPNNDQVQSEDEKTERK